MSNIYKSEKLNNYPVPQDGVSFGNISANGISTFIGVGNTIFSGSYSFDTITLTLKGIDFPAPYSKPTAQNSGNDSFNFRGRKWTLLDVTEGYIFTIGTRKKYESWSITGVDLNRPTSKIG